MFKEWYVISKTNQMVGIIIGMILNYLNRKIFFNCTNYKHLCVHILGIYMSMEYDLKF